MGRLIQGLVVAQTATESSRTSRHHSWLVFRNQCGGCGEVKRARNVMFCWLVDFVPPVGRAKLVGQRFLLLLVRRVFVGIVIEAGWCWNSLAVYVDLLSGSLCSRLGIGI